MFQSKTQSNKLFSTVINIVALSIFIGLNPTAVNAELSGGASSTSLTGGASSTSLSGGASSTSLSGSASSTSLSGGANSSSLSGGAKETLLNGSASQTHKAPLQGGIKDDATMRSSLRLLKPSTDKGQPLAPGINSTFMPGQVTQFNGHTSTGSLAPVFQPQTPSNTTYQRPQSGFIPPISTYTLQRNTSRTWVAPGYEVTPANVSRSTAVVPPTSSSSYASSQRGVTTWVPGFDVTSVSQSAAAAALPTLMGHGQSGGVAAYLPQYEVHKVTANVPAMMFDPPFTTHSGVTAYKPGFEVTVTSRSNGVTRFTPGFELSHVVPNALKETLSGVWHSGGTAPPLVATQGVLQHPQFTKVLVPDLPRPLVATTLLLPQLRSQADEKLTWDEWYKRVAHAIYCRWQYADVGPGMATVRMVVTRDRDVGCQLINFVPAADIKRDVTAETKFRESAVNAVNMVTKFEIPDLPMPFTSDKVVFDLDLKRTVDGPTGVDVASAHQ